MVVSDDVHRRPVDWLCIAPVATKRDNTGYWDIVQAPFPSIKWESVSGCNANETLRLVHTADEHAWVKSDNFE